MKVVCVCEPIEREKSHDEGVKGRQNTDFPYLG